MIRLHFVVCSLLLIIGHQHASEIAFMSLDLLVGVSTFCIPHRPYEKIKIRVGVNSGSCVAGKIQILFAYGIIHLNLFRCRWNEHAAILSVWYKIFGTILK